MTSRSTLVIDCSALVDHVRGVGREPQPRAAGPARQVGRQRRAEDGHPVVAHHQRELPSEVRGVEVRFGGEDPLDAGHRGADPRAQLDRQRGEPVLVAEPGEQLVAEVAAQPGQLGRDRGLAEAELFGGPADAALLEQRIQVTSRFRSRLVRFTSANVSTCGYGASPIRLP